MAQYRPHHLDPSLQTARVWLVCRDFSGGSVSHVGLLISADYTAKSLGHHGVWAEAVTVRSAGDLAKRLHACKHGAVERHEVRPSHVVISAPWIRAREIAVLAAEHPEIRFYVVCHSNVGFLQADPGAVAIMKEIVELQLGTHNVFAAGNSEKFVRWATDAWRVSVAWAPNLYPASDIFHHKEEWAWLGWRRLLGLDHDER